MASLLSHDVLELPQDVVTSSPGLAFDIGSSIAKIVYRSNKEYKAGRPLEKQSPGIGRVHLAKFLRENTDDVIAFIEENCDFSRDEEGFAHISATGIGGSQFKVQIEKKLKIKIKVLAEFDCFVKTFKELSSTLKREELLYPIPAKGKEEGERMQKLMREWREVGGVHLPMEEEDDPVEDDDDDDDGLHLPCMMVMSGSGAGIMHIKEDGTYQMIEGIYTAGRSFLGLVAASTGEKDFGKMMEMAEASDGRTATTFTSDLRPDQPEDDSYGPLLQADFPAFPVGKVYTAKREDVKDGDIIQGIYYLFGLVHAQIVELQCTIHNVKKAYFCGNFIENEVARTNITLARVGRNMLTPKGKRADFQFLRNGGVYGALGAFFIDSEAPRTTSKDTP